MRRIIKPLAIFSAILLLGLVVLGFARNQSLHLVGTNTTGGVLADGSDILVLTFSDALSTDIDTSTANIELEPADKRGSVSIEGRNLKIGINTGVTSSQITLTIHSLQSIDGKELRDLKQTFQVKPLAFSELPAAEQERQYQQATVRTATAPILDILPITTADYNITYNLRPSTNGTENVVLIIDVLGVGNEPEDSLRAGTLLKTVRQKALDDIRSRGYDPGNFAIDYAEIEPSAVNGGHDHLD